MDEPRPIRVLFVCTGNICRSPMAEGIFNHLVKQAELSDRIISDSAGTSAYHVGEATSRGTVLVLRKNGIHFDTTSRQFVENDTLTFDYIIGMEGNHANWARRYARMTGGNPVIARLLDYTTEWAGQDVPDPYYDDSYEEVYPLVLSGAQGLLAAIRREKSLP